jgi:nucleoside-diphosphate-sugar epimerase
VADDSNILSADDLILVTGASGFIGTRVVEALVRHGFRNVRCFVRPSSKLGRLDGIIAAAPAQARIEVTAGNLLYRDDCEKAAKDAAVVIHLAAGRDKAYAGRFLNTVVTTRNLLDAVTRGGTLRRFVNVSAFDVYSNWNLRRGGLFDEQCELESHFNERADAASFAKLKQDEVVMEYGRKHGMPFVILRPGAVYGPGHTEITGRVGIGTFGVFLHLGGPNRLPLSYVDNCAEAIVLAAIRPGVDGEIFNVVDDDLPTSRKFLRLYKRHAHRFRSIRIPYPVFYVFSALWEKYSSWSQGQLPPAFNRRRCAYYWKGQTYSNRKLKERLGWRPIVPFAEAARRYFDYVRKVGIYHA